jgi:prepilin-type N-terminal cleavage/methylation domain-containing protein
MANFKYNRKSSNLSNRGFTLIEAMVATVILSLGTVFIFESFFISLNTYQYCADYLKVASWADNKLWEIQSSLSSLGPSASLQTSGRFSQLNKDYTWSVGYGSVDVTGILYRIDRVLSWQEGMRQVKLKRSAYARYEE